MAYDDLQSKDKILAEIMEYAEAGMASDLKRRHAPPPPAPAAAPVPEDDEGPAYDDLAALVGDGSEPLAGV